jgi:thymidylate synthase (FAD)
MPDAPNNWWQTLEFHRQFFRSFMTQSPVYDPLGDGISQLQLIDVMGTDLSVTNDARASFNNCHQEWQESSDKLIKFLAQSQPPHTSPFRGCALKFKVTAPLFLCRQWYKHAIASAHLDDQNQWNEQSFRYTELKQPKFYIPRQFRTQSSTNKQSSDIPLSDDTNQRLKALFDEQYQLAYSSYQTAIASGVCREQARALLPASTYTTWIWTCSLQSILHFLALRSGHGAQSEIIAYADTLSEIVSTVFPKSYQAWLTDK